MLIQIALFAEIGEPQARLEMLLEPLDVAVRSEVAEIGSVKDVDGPADIVIADSSVLVAPLPDTVAAIRASNEGLDVIIVRGPDGPPPRPSATRKIAEVVPKEMIAAESSLTPSLFVAQRAE